MLRVYYHPLSTYSQRVRIALLEKNIPAEMVEVDLPGRAQFRPEYLSKNPYGRVPAIDEDGWVLYESTAILEYLEATRPSPPLLPPDPRDRARVAMHTPHRPEPFFCPGGSFPGSAGTSSRWRRPRRKSRSICRSWNRRSKARSI